MSDILLQPLIQPPNNWSVTITRENVRDVPPEFGFEDPNGKLWRPYEVITPRDSLGDPRITAINQDGITRGISLDAIPHMRSYIMAIPDAPGGHLATLRHRKGRAEGATEFPEREKHLRILRFAGIDDPDFAPTGIFYSEEGHPDHPGEPGMYWYAEHVGYIGLRVANHVEFLPPEDVRAKYFPIPRSRT